MMQAVEDSLRRLQTDYIDLYQSHRDDPATPIEETLSAYADLIKQGKVREIGASNFSADAAGGVVADQHRQGPAALSEPAAAIQPRGAGRVRGAAGRSVPEGENWRDRLLLAGQRVPDRQISLAQTDAEGRARGARGEKYLNDYGFGVLAALDDVAKRYNAKPVQVAMAWLIARPSVTAPIASATNLDQLAELVKAAEIKLDAAAIQQIDAASKPR